MSMPRHGGVASQSIVKIK